MSRTIPMKRKYEYNNYSNKKMNIPKQVVTKSTVRKMIQAAAEVKSFAVDSGINQLANYTFTTFNILSTLTKGVSSSQRVGSLIHIKDMNIKMLFGNKTTIPTTNNSTLIFRIVVFRGKYDYALANYPSSEVFEGGLAGTTPQSIFTGRIDKNQVSCLYDKTFTYENRYSNQVMNIFREVSQKYNRKFYFKDDDEYGTTSNLYIGFCYGTDSNVGGTVQFNFCINYTDL